MFSSPLFAVQASQRILLSGENSNVILASFVESFGPVNLFVDIPVSAWIENFRYGNLPAGSQVTIFLDGHILGRGGNGGDGEGTELFEPELGGWVVSPQPAATDGTAGGDALVLTANTNLFVGPQGSIWAGGGGAAGAGIYFDSNLGRQTVGPPGTGGVSGGQAGISSLGNTRDDTGSGPAAIVPVYSVGARGGHWGEVGGSSSVANGGAPGRAIVRNNYHLNFMNVSQQDLISSNRIIGAIHD